VLAGDEAALAVTRIAVGVIGRATEDGETVVLLVEFHDAVVGDIAAQQVAPFREIGGAFRPAHAGGYLFQRTAVDAVSGEAGVEDLDRRVRVALVRREGKGLRCRAAREGGRAEQAAGGAEQDASFCGHSSGLSRCRGLVPLA
jgi:hypothetical protein